MEGVPVQKNFITIGGVDYVFPLVVKNPDKEREFCLPKFPYRNGKCESISSQEDVAKRNAALDRISEERPDVYNVWMLEKDHELSYAFEPLFYQDTMETDTSCEICGCADKSSQLGFYSFPYHCRPRRQHDSWETLEIVVCFDCFFIAGHRFPTWSRGRDSWDAYDAWNITVEDVLQMLELLEENCKDFKVGKPVRTDFDEQWIKYIGETQNKERYVKPH